MKFHVQSEASEYKSGAKINFQNLGICLEWHALLQEISSTTWGLELSNFGYSPKKQKDMNKAINLDSTEDSKIKKKDLCF